MTQQTGMGRCGLLEYSYDSKLESKWVKKEKIKKWAKVILNEENEDYHSVSYQQSEEEQRLFAPCLFFQT